MQEWVIIQCFWWISKTGKTICVYSHKENEKFWHEQCFIKISLFSKKAYDNPVEWYLGKFSESLCHSNLSCFDQITSFGNDPKVWKTTKTTTTTAKNKQKQRIRLHNFLSVMSLLTLLDIITCLILILHFYSPRSLKVTFATKVLFAIEYPSMSN